MTELLLHKFLLLLFILSILNIIRNGWFVVNSYRRGGKFQITDISLILLGISISYFFTILFSGFLK